MPDSAILNASTLEEEPRRQDLPQIGVSEPFFLPSLFPRARFHGFISNSLKTGCGRP
jgi:hypothetical protein